MVNNFWSGKKVFLTGHTGFKGSWMSLWLLRQGAELTGYSLGLPTQPSLFQELDIARDMNSIFGDIRNLGSLRHAVQDARPEIVIHMAAQPLVRYSYDHPVETYMTNVIGTVHLFESIRECSSVRAVVNVTSDKCYENRERIQGYKEDEAMGGFDPYSNSKGCAELVTTAYRRSYFKKSGVMLGSGRAGNVIGGGDWAGDRLIPDIIRAVDNNDKLLIRSPQAVRPWQHVLEPISGYLRLAEKLYLEGERFAEGFNFGPSLDDHVDVGTILKKMNSLYDGKLNYEIMTGELQHHEARLLSLDCTKAQDLLGWSPRWKLDMALEKTVLWNRMRQSHVPVKEICLSQLDSYEDAL